jgi:dUTPase
MTNNHFLFNYYPSFMHLRIFVDGPDDLHMKYIEAVNKHNSKIFDDPTHIDAGFDLYVPNHTHCERNFSNQNQNFVINKIDHHIRCSATIMSESGQHNTGYYLHPRSSVSRTPLRLANSTGIVDAGYRGHIIGMFDCFADQHVVEKNDRLLQICAPSLMPIFVEIVNNEQDLGGVTMRGGGGFGSTGR